MKLQPSNFSLIIDFAGPVLEERPVRRIDGGTMQTINGLKKMIVNGIKTMTYLTILCLFNIALLFPLAPVRAAPVTQCCLGWYVWPTI